MKDELVGFLATVSYDVGGGVRFVQTDAAPSEAGHGGGHNGISQASLGLEPAQYGFLLALLSGVSMPIGAMLGLKFHPDDHTCSGWIAVGAGALLFAVSVELYGHAIHDFVYGRMHEPAMAILMLVSLLGAVFFTWVTRLLEGEEDVEDDSDEEEVCRACGKCLPEGSLFCFRCGVRVLPHDRSIYGTFLREVSPFSTSQVSSMRRMSLPARSTPGVIDDDHPGLTPLTSRHPNHGRTMIGAKLRAAKAQERDKARRRWKLLRQAFQTLQIIRYLRRQARLTRLRSGGSRLPRAESSLSVMTGGQSAQDQAGDDSPEFSPKTSAMLGTSSFSLSGSISVEAFPLLQSVGSLYSKAKDIDGEMTEIELENMQHNRSGALKMYAMLVIDGVPEGILMGFLAAADHLSITLVLSFLIANFPEAFAGGVLMEKGGFSRWQIFGLWGGLMVMVAAFAGIACELLLMVDPEFTGEAHVPFNIQCLVAVMEGLAGGAMLSGIAGTMLPEAYERRNKSGWLVASGGFLCTVGFLTAVAIKITLG